ncbi:hypothetical protein M885DRAFT_569396 [Pelagophyceae sp. CCMP2097]|nr:hypothetical protein M885DRAFT_569396 [Pelagophyceae sp. CCMP2097]
MARRRARGMLWCLAAIAALARADYAPGAVRWAVAEVKVDGRATVVACASGGGAGPCGAVARTCAATDDAAACNAALGEHLEALAFGAADGGAAFDAPDAALDSAGAEAVPVDVALAVMWAASAPAVLDVAVGSAVPLRYVSRRPLPGNVRVCFAVTVTYFDASADGGGDADELTVCESDFGEFAAARVDGADSFEAVSLGNSYLKLSLPRKTRLGGVAAVLAYVVAETDGGNVLLGQAWSGDRAALTCRIAPPGDASSPSRATVRHWPPRGDSDGGGGGASRIETVDAPAVPMATRSSTVFRVAYDKVEKTLLLFSLSAEPPPAVLGRLRNGGAIGAWRRTRVVNESYAAFPCGARVKRGQSQQFVQPPQNQYHFLYTAFTAMIQAAARQKGGAAGGDAATCASGDACAAAPDGRPLLLLDAANGAAALDARSVAQLGAIYARHALWDDFFAEAPRFTCFDELQVGLDDADSLHGYTHLTHGLVSPDTETASPGSARRRSADALRAMRDILRKLFAPKVDFAPNRRAGDYGSTAACYKALLILRRGTRRFADADAVVAAVRRGCQGAARGACCDVETVALEDHSYQDQIRLLARADMLIAVEGQGLANMVYLRDDAAVSILVPAGFDQAAVDYTNIAALLGLAVETTLRLRGPTEVGFFDKGDYWSNANDKVHFDADVVEATVRTARDRQHLAAEDP